MSNLFVDLLEEDQKQQNQLKGKAAEKDTFNRTQPRDNPRDRSSGKSRDHSRDTAPEASCTFPTRDEIQEFSFHLRDALNVKVQAELPHEWQAELERIALDLRVKKLELYRYIYGTFLGKIKTKK